MTTTAEIIRHLFTADKVDMAMRCRIISALNAADRNSAFLEEALDRLAEKDREIYLMKVNESYGHFARLEERLARLIHTVNHINMEQG